jgi:hypothetical protein
MVISLSLCGHSTLIGFDNMPWRNDVMLPFIPQTICHTEYATFGNKTKTKTKTMDSSWCIHPRIDFGYHCSILCGIELLFFFKNKWVGLNFFVFFFF